MAKQTTQQTIENNFNTHTLSSDQQQRADSLRNTFRRTALELVANTPPSREQALALTNLEQVMFWAVASIARAETPAAPAATEVNGNVAITTQSDDVTRISVNDPALVAAQ